MGIFALGYERHQYGEWLLGTVANILDDDLSISSAGLLRGGAIAWVEVSVPESITTPEGVEFRPNLLATTSFDGSTATTFKRTVTDVVCDNTRETALAEPGQEFKVKHSRYSVARLGEAREALAIVHTLADEFAAEVAQLCATPVTAGPVAAVPRPEPSLAPTPTGSRLTGRSLTMADTKRGTPGAAVRARRAGRALGRDRPRRPAGGQHLRAPRGHRAGCHQGGAQHAPHASAGTSASSTGPPWPPSTASSPPDHRHSGPSASCRRAFLMPRRHAMSNPLPHIHASSTQLLRHRQRWVAPPARAAQGRLAAAPGTDGRRGVVPGPGRRRRRRRRGGVRARPQGRAPCSSPSSGCTPPPTGTAPDPYALGPSSGTTTRAGTPSGSPPTRRPAATSCRASGLARRPSPTSNREPVASSALAEVSRSEQVLEATVPASEGDPNTCARVTNRA